MPRYVINAKTPAGESRTIEREAGTQTELLSALLSENLTPVSIRDADTRTSGRVTRRPSDREVARFLEGFADLLRAGLDISLCLSTLERECGSSMAPVVNRIARDIDGGARLSESMERTGIFPRVHCRILRAAEHSGNLEKGLRRSSADLLRRLEIRASVIQAVAYPAFVVGFGLVSLLVMILFVLPKFAAIYQGMNATLPPVTSALLNGSVFLRAYGVWISLVVLVFAVLLWHQRKHPRIRRIGDVIRNSLPFVGAIFRDGEVASTLRNLGILIQSGIPIAQSLDIGASISSSERFAHALRNVASGVRSGRRLSSELRQSGLFKESVLGVVAVAERSSRLDSTLLETAERIEKETDQSIRKLLVLLEPILILLVGMIVGVMVIAMLLPIFSLSSSIQR